MRQITAGLGWRLQLSCNEQSGSTNPPATTEKAVTSKPAPVEPKPVEKFIPTRDLVVGQWRMVMTKPSHKNTLTRRYMRHSFFDDGRLVIENEEDSNKEATWEFSDGLVVVKSSYGPSNFVDHYKLNNRDTLKKIRFQRFVGGERKADAKKDETFIRQGSDTEKRWKVYNVFAFAAKAQNFIDPNTLKIDSTYTLSKRTPIMPSYEVSDLNEMAYANSGDSITIVGKTTVRSIVWYQVESQVKNGWVNSTALFGQELKQ
jgi:hypothetical protein